MNQSNLGGTFTLPNTFLTLNRMGYGAMQLAGRDGKKLVWGPPRMCRERSRFCVRSSPQE